MSNNPFPRVVNIYFNPKNDIPVHCNQIKHLVAAISRRGANRLCFKLSTEYCKANLPEAYNNSLMDINIAAGECRMYPKGKIIEEVQRALEEIEDWFVEGGLVNDCEKRSERSDI